MTHHHLNYLFVRVLCYYFLSLFRGDVAAQNISIFRWVSLFRACQIWEVREFAFNFWCYFNSLSILWPKWFLKGENYFLHISLPQVVKNESMALWNIWNKFDDMMFNNWHRNSTYHISCFYYFIFLLLPISFSQIDLWKPFMPHYFSNLTF